ncbi:MAG: putative ABC transporter permease, partial [Spirochaetales bacterium]|nr:putative ABC transporter permease [Spirochaetales bacterium]
MEYLTNLLLLFFIYSFAGWCIEVTLKFRQYHRFINRGFLTGPCLPIYGSGCALITAAVDILVMISRYESSYGSVFAVAFVLCGVLEYTVSYLLE